MLDVLEKPVSFASTRISIYYLHKKFLAETDTCEMSACEYFVEYDGDEFLDPTIDKICPEVMTSSSFDKEVIIEYSGIFQLVTIKKRL